MMISAWTHRLITKILPKYNDKIVNVDEESLKVGDSDLLGLEIKLNNNLFIFVERFTSMIELILYNIPGSYST